MKQAPDTLRQRLMRAALWPALVVVLISGVFDYLMAVDLAQQSQDSLLLKTVAALATRMSPDEDGESRDALSRHLDPEDAAMLRSDPGDEIRFLVLDGQGEVLVGDRQLLTLLGSGADVIFEKPFFSDRRLNGVAVRVVDFSHKSRGVSLRVLVTETNRKRMATSSQILLSTLWPNLLLLLVMALLMKRGVRKALDPLKSIGQAIDLRPANDLTPIPVARVPGEILPLMMAMNGMLERIAKTAAEQQVFLSGAAHQLRTPLAGIQMQLELAGEHASPESRERIQRIYGAIDNLAHCTQQMLTLARSSAQASTANDQAHVNLEELLEDAASTWLDMAVRHKTEMAFELQAACCWGSRWMLQEMLGNFIDNAIKHSPAGGLVTLRCGLDEEQRPFFEVEDQGPGISVPDQAQVFEPFFRGSQTLASGSGLGLAIAREVANRHLATISFLDTQSQQGTLIRVTFPFAVAKV